MVQGVFSHVFRGSWTSASGNVSGVVEGGCGRVSVSLINGDMNDVMAL